MTNKDELKNEELDQVTGGSSTYIDSDTELPKYQAICPKQLSSDDAADYVGKNVLYLRQWTSGKNGRSKHYEWCYGTVTNSYTETWSCNKEVRKLDINVVASGGEYAGITGNKTISMAYYDKVFADE